MSLNSEAGDDKMQDLKEQTILDWITEYLMFKGQFDAVSGIFLCFLFYDRYTFKICSSKIRYTYLYL